MRWRRVRVQEGRVLEDHGCVTSTAQAKARTALRVHDAAAGYRSAGHRWWRAASSRAAAVTALTIRGASRAICATRRRAELGRRVANPVATVAVDSALDA